MTSIISSSRVPKAALLLSVALFLSACGGSNDRDTPAVTPPPPTGTTPPPVASDTFFQTVLARVSSLLDNDEPISIETIPVTSPENSEPEPVPTT